MNRVRVFAQIAGLFALLLVGNNFAQAQSSPFSVNVEPKSITMKTGQSETATVIVIPTEVGTYTGDVTFSCVGLPTNASCVFNPTPLSFVNGLNSGNQYGTTTLTVYTDGFSHATTAQQNKRWLFPTGIVFAGVLMFPFARRRNWGSAMLLGVVFLTAFGASCGGSSHNYTAVGTYNITINSSSKTASGTTAGPSAALSFVVTKN